MDVRELTLLSDGELIFPRLKSYHPYRFNKDAKLERNKVTMSFLKNDIITVSRGRHPSNLSISLNSAHIGSFFSTRDVHNLVVDGILTLEKI